MAVLNIRVQDDGGLSIGGAVLSFVRTDGTPVNFVTDADGRFPMIISEDYPELANNNAGVRITAAGFSDVVGPSLAGDIVIIRMKKKLGAPVLFGGAILIVLALAAGSGKPKKVKGININSVRPWLIPVGIVVAGYVVLSSLFGKSPQDKAYDDALDKGIDDASAQNPPIKTDAELAVIADTLYNDLHYYFTSDDNPADVLAQFERINNLAELLKLIKLFGTRSMYVFGVPKGSFTLQQMVHETMTGDQVNLINSYFANAGIDFQF